MTYQAFFFDFDGVLADSVEVKTRAFAKLYEPYGKEIVDKIVEHHRMNGGMTRREKFVFYHSKYLNMSLSGEFLEELCRKFSYLVFDEVINSREIPGSVEFLKKWYKKVQCFVVSAAPEEEIVNITKCRSINIYFREVLGSNRSKRENLEMILEKYGLEPDKCIFFGDAESDYHAAKESGVNFMGILPGPEAPLLKTAPKIKWAKNFIDVNIS